MNKLVIVIIGVLVLAGLNQSGKPTESVPTRPASSDQSSSLERSTSLPPTMGRPAVSEVPIVVPTPAAPKPLPRATTPQRPSPLPSNPARPAVSEVPVVVPTPATPETSSRTAAPDGSVKPPSVTEQPQITTVPPIEPPPIDFTQVHTAASQRFVVKALRLNVRTEASANASKTGELVQGEEIESLNGEEVRGWVRISARGGKLRGWVKRSYLAELERQGLTVPSTSDVNASGRSADTDASGLYVLRPHSDLARD